MEVALSVAVACTPTAKSTARCSTFGGTHKPPQGGRVHTFAKRKMKRPVMMMKKQLIEYNALPQERASAHHDDQLMYDEKCQHAGMVRNPSLAKVSTTNRM